MCIPSIEARSTERGYESIVKYCFFIVLVLIDTWWNVNQLAEGGVLKKGQGFNRYIVWNDNKENIINIKGEKIK